MVVCGYLDTIYDKMCLIKGQMIMIIARIYKIHFLMRINAQPPLSYV